MSTSVGRLTLLASFVSLLALTGAGCADDSAPAKNTETKTEQKSVGPIEGFVAYENQDLPVKMQYPKDWVKEETKEEDGTILALYSPDESKNDKFRENMVITTYAIPSPDATLEDFITFVEENQKKSIDNFTSTDKGAVTVGGQTGKKKQMSGKLKGPQYTFMQYFVMNKGKAYSFLFTAEPAQFDKYLPTVEKIISSVEL